MFPSQFQYKTAVQNQMFPSDENGGYTFTPFIRDGEPVSSSGGQAIVFRVIDSQENEIALKLFLHELEDRFNRFKAISNYINQFQNDLFLPFQFIEKLIYVDLSNIDENNYFPGVIMKWINAPTMEEKLRQLVAAKDSLGISKMAANFRELSLNLLELKIAHGDLKTNNILVDENLKLFLIDYDGMYVPSFIGKISIENGTPSYQHPKREHKDFNEKIDQFSILNIYTSLLLVANNLELFQKFNDGDNIVFRVKDLLDPENSELFDLKFNNDFVNKLVLSLKQSLLSDNIYIDNICDLLEGKFPEPDIQISYKGDDIFIGDLIEFTWISHNCNLVRINGVDCSYINSLEIKITKEFIDVELGNEFESKTFVYPINLKKKPIVKYFKANETEIKSGEILNLNWSVVDYEKIILSYNSLQHDVTNLTSFNITDLSKSQFILLKIYPLDSKIYIEEKLYVQVLYPIYLEIELSKRAIFRNEPLTINLLVENATEVLILPLSEKITGLNQFTFRPTESLTFTVIAKNKFYSKQVEKFVEVIAPPNYSQKIINLPKVEINLPFLIINKSTWQNELVNLKKSKFSFYRYSSLVKAFRNIKIKL